MLKPEERRARDSAELIAAGLGDVAASLRSLRDKKESGIPETEVATPEDHIPEAISVFRTIANRIDALVSQNDSQGKETDRFQKKYLIIQWLLFWATAGAFVAAAIYAHIASLQKDTMDRTLTEITKQTKSAEISAQAAKSAAEISALTMRLGERAWLTVKYPPIPMDVGSRITVPLTFENTGRTAARSLTGLIAVSVIDANEKPNFTYLSGYYSWNSGYLSEGTPATNYWNALDRKTRDDIILTNTINVSIRSGKQVITIHGRIDYDDIFHIHHWITFCQQSGPIQNGMQIPGNKDCSAYNQTDDNQ